MDRNEIVEVSFDFALQIISFCEKLEESKKFIIANQLLKSGTSIGAIFAKHKMQKVSQISYTKLKLLQRRQRKRNTGFYYAKNPKIILLQMNY